MYNKIVFLTRENFFYKDFKLSDSFSNRIYLIFFHLCFILIVLKNKESDKNYQQAIFDFFFRQIELNCRELGYGDTKINNEMKKLVKSFYGILIICKKIKLKECIVIIILLAVPAILLHCFQKDLHFAYASHQQCIFIFPGPTFFGLCYPFGSRLRAGRRLGAGLAYHW